MVTDEQVAEAHSIFDNAGDRSPIAQRLDTIISLLQKQTKEGFSQPAPGALELRDGVARTTHIKMRATRIVFSMSAADNVNLTIGTQTYTFYDLGTGIQQIEWGRVIERGVDIKLDVIGGATLGAAWIVFVPE